ncbi:Protein kinase C signaling pathway involved MAPKK protein [Steccherinum ochraceum]|uniref:mitogen-activated protein kinase kinase n=1 Tax=Steccherinum ochraceum TaxID=92696 RepID=A0A4R0S3H4_9APHY|nr:Protein kinase C signaling pathway involved MAPKK protein [Steccherinum ochraceum]
MHSMHSSPARPMGPRIQRPSSPPTALKLPEIAPLNINRRPSATKLPALSTQNINGNGSAQVHQDHPPALLSLPALSPPARSRSPTPTISLLIPGSAPTPGRPKLKLPAMDFGESAFAGGYAGGPNTQNGSPHLISSSTDGPGEATIRPQLTISPQPRPPPISMDNIRQTVEEFDQWSDELLEEQNRLGEGAGGAVYKVRDKRTGLIMARKTITTHEAPMKQLLREIKITSSTEHINIIHFFGAYISPSSSEVKVLMEFCEGGSLESVGKRMRQIGGRVSEKVAGRLADGILQGLAYLHSRKTIHRDIKPPNILLTREGVVKLCDFGVSGELVNSNAGTFTGTSLYMAPERLSGLNYSIRSDVWSTGISLLELIQNRFPFPNDLADIELMMYITQNEPPELEDEEDISYSPEMKDFVKVALTRNPNMRPTPKELLDHPWIVAATQNKVNMAYWVRKVWGWPAPTRRSGDGSRPGSSRSEVASLDASMSAMRISSDSPPQDL